MAKKNDKYVSNGALVTCSQSVHKIKVEMIAASKTEYGNRLVLTEKDNTAASFKGSFGSCKRRNEMACSMGKFVGWFDTNEEANVDNAHPIVMESILVCMTGGGYIKPVTDGQESEEMLKKLKEETIAKWLKVINSKNIEKWKREFVVSVLDTLYDKSMESGIPIELMFGQMMTESTYGSDVITQNANNYYGMKGVGPAGSYSTLTTEETTKGDIKITDGFKAYNNIEESIDDYIGWINRNVTPNVSNNSAQSWADALEASPYATRTGYGDAVLNVADYWGVLSN